MNKTQLILIILLTINIFVTVFVPLFYPLKANAQSDNRIKECSWYDHNTIINDVIAENGLLSHIELTINGGTTIGGFLACW